MKELSTKARKVKSSSTLSISAKAKAIKAAGEPLIAFTAGEPDFDTPQHIKDAAFEAAKKGFTKYTATAGIIELRNAICQKLKTDNGLSYTPGQIVVSNGAKQALANVFNALLNPQDEVIMPAPYWLTYPELITLADGVPKIIETTADNSYKPTAAQFAKAITPKTKAIIINSPNNPTGAVLNRNELADIADIAVKNDLYVISDEIYEYLIYNDQTPHISIASLGPDIFERTIVVNGYSKSYSMTGWRVGYTASNKAIADIIENIQSHQTSNINTLTQKAAQAAEEGSKEAVIQMRNAFIKRRDLMYGLISDIAGISPAYPEGAFYIFADISKLCGKAYNGQDDIINNAADFARLLLDIEKVAIIPCADFGYPNHIRLSYATNEGEIEEGLGRIKAFVNKLA